MKKNIRKRKSETGTGKGTFTMEKRAFFNEFRMKMFGHEKLNIYQAAIELVILVGEVEESPSKPIVNVNVPVPLPGSYLSKTRVNENL